jgi:hypothetical protein
MSDRAAAGQQDMGTGQVCDQARFATQAARPEDHVLGPVVSDMIPEQGSHEKQHEETMLEELLASTARRGSDIARYEQLSTDMRIIRLPGGRTRREALKTLYREPNVTDLQGSVLLAEPRHLQP